MSATVASIWEELADYTLPSVNESKASANTFADELEDGSYQFAIVDISPPLPNSYKKKDGVTPGNPRRGLTLRVVNSDDPNDVGLQTIQYVTESTHPKSSLFQIFRTAAYGGNMPPAERPKLIFLRNAQFRATLATGPSENDPTKMVQKLQGLLPAKKKFPIPERRQQVQEVSAEESPAPWDEEE